MTSTEMDGWKIYEYYLNYCIVNTQLVKTQIIAFIYNVCQKIIYTNQSEK